MRLLTICTAAVIPVLAGVAMGQTKIVTFEDYQKLMRSNAQLGGAMNAALSGPSYTQAREVLRSVRQNFVALQGFWRELKRADAITIVTEGLKQIDALDQMLATETDLALVQKAAQEFGRTTCAACHKLYREGDEETGFRFKPGVF